MNFISHFYFDKFQQNKWIVLGIILPDLFKNTDKKWNAHPEKNEQIFEFNKNYKSIILGWKRHLEVDKIFHSSSFFENETRILKSMLQPILKNSEVRPSFLAHIGVELMLDHLLLIKNKVNINHLYDQLQQIEPNEIHNFLNLCNIQGAEKFKTFYNNFIDSKYLISYDKTENITYALKRICMRIWDNPIDNKTEIELKNILDIYKNHIEENFMIIFDEIENRLF